jgi:hypothetical protein
MHTLLAEGIDLRGYFHWTLADNFEWNEGWHLRFGLYELDPATQVRRPRSSAHVYERMIKQSSSQSAMSGPCGSGTPNSTHLALKETDAPSRTIVTENEGAFGK